MFTVSRDASVSSLREAIDGAGISATSVTMLSDTLYGDECLLLLEYSGDDDANAVCDKLVKSGIASTAEPDGIKTLTGLETSTDTQVVVADGSDAGTTVVSATSSEAASSLESTSINDRYQSLQWALDSINAYDAWDYVKAEGAVTVAVIDSGVDYDHPDLANNLILGDYAKDTYADSTGTAAVDDSLGHGTHVAGIITAEANNSIGVAGVSYNAKVLPIKATCDSEGHLYDSDIIEAIDYVVSLRIDEDSPDYLKNIRVINMSLGGYNENTTYETAIASARSAGIMVVAAAGNESTNQKVYPASYDGVVGVSALKESTSGPGEFDTEYSNYGSYVDIAAPGTHIASTYLNGGYSYLSGTSMATPIVSGVAAAIYSRDLTFTPDQVESMLEESAVDLGDEGRDDYYGYGAVDLAAAVVASCTHSVELVPAKVATCTEPGNNAYYQCSLCGQCFRDEGATIPTTASAEAIEADGHTLVAIPAVPATCTSAGLSEGSRCSVCGAIVVSQEVVPALGHNFGSWIIDTPSTQTTDGLRSHTCLRCETTETEVIPAGTNPYSELAAVKVLGRSIVLDGSVGMNVLMAIPDEVKAVDDSYVEMLTADGDVACKAPLSAATKAGTSDGVPTYAFTGYVAAMCANDDLTIRVVTDEGWALNLLDADGNDCTETGIKGSVASRYDSTVANVAKSGSMLASMLYFGSACQTYFGHNADALSTSYLADSKVASLKAEADALTVNDLASYKPSSTDTTAVKCVGANLAFGSSVDVLGYFEIDEGTAEDYAFTVDGETATATLVTDFGWSDADSTKTYVRVTKAGITADKLDATHSFKVLKSSDGTVASALEYGPMGYAWVALSNVEKFQPIDELVRSMYVYNKYAKEYKLATSTTSC